jgi:hypothetical protein
VIAGVSAVIAATTTTIYAQGEKTPSRVDAAKSCKLKREFFPLPSGITTVDHITKFQDRACFGANKNGEGALWCTNGSSIEQVYDIGTYGGTPVGPVEYDGKLYFVAGEDSSGRWFNCLHRYDGGNASRFFCAGSERIEALEVVVSQLWFYVSRVGWHFYDGTAVQQFTNPGIGRWERAVVHEGSVYGYDFSSMLMNRYDGVNTSQVGDPNDKASDVMPVAVFNNELLVSRGAQLWAFDGYTFTAQKTNVGAGFMGVPVHTIFKDTFYATPQRGSSSTMLVAISRTEDSKTVYSASSTLDALGVLGNYLVFRADGNFMCFDGTSIMKSDPQIAVDTSFGTTATTLDGAVILAGKHPHGAVGIYSLKLA